MKNDDAAFLKEMKSAPETRETRESEGPKDGNVGIAEGAAFSLE